MRRSRKVVEFVSAQVPVPLTEAEQRIKAFQLADLCKEIDRVRAAAAADAGGARKSIQALEKRRRLLAECVRTGAEMRNAQEDLFREPRTEPAVAPNSPAQFAEPIPSDGT